MSKTILAALAALMLSTASLADDLVSSRVRAGRSLFDG
jgi:hypothetical protein